MSAAKIEQIYLRRSHELLKNKLNQRQTLRLTENSLNLRLLLIRI